MSSITTPELVATILKVTEPDADQAFQTAYAAAERWHARRCTWEIDELGEPVDVEDLVQSVVLLTGRYMARRNSPDGLLNMGELGVMRLSKIDADVASLSGPYRKIVV